MGENSSVEVFVELRKQLFKERKSVVVETVYYDEDGSERLAPHFSLPEGFIIPREKEDFILTSSKLTISGHVNRITHHLEYDKGKAKQTILITLIMFDELHKIKRIKF